MPLQILIQIPVFAVLQHDAHRVVPEARSEQPRDIPIGQPCQLFCLLLKFYPGKNTRHKEVISLWSATLRTRAGYSIYIHGLERLYRTSINYVIYSLECIYIYVYVCMSVYICIYKIVKTIKCLNNWEQGSVRRMESEWNLIRQRVKTEFG